MSAETEEHGPRDRLDQPVHAMSDYDLWAMYQGVAREPEPPTEKVDWQHEGF